MTEPKDPTAKDQELSSPSETDTLKTHLLIGLTASMTMMAEKVGDLASASRTLTRRVEQGDEERERDRRWFKLACTVFALSYALGAFVIWDNRQNVKNTADSLAILRTVTGPEATRAQSRETQRVVDSILANSDCQGEENLRIFMEAVRPQLTDIQIPAERPECAVLREQREATTTTRR